MTSYMMLGSLVMEIKEKEVKKWRNGTKKKKIVWLKEKVNYFSLLFLNIYVFLPIFEREAIDGEKDITKIC